jgi:hypothetical protein
MYKDARPAGTAYGLVYPRATQGTLLSQPPVQDPHVKLLPLPQPPLRTRTDAQTNPSARRATQLMSVLARVYAVARQNC